VTRPSTANANNLEEGGHDMNKFRQFVIRLATVVVIASSSIYLSGQTVASARQTGSITVSMTLDNNHFQVGQSPDVRVTINNQTDHNIPFHFNMLLLHIEGGSGEPRTEIRQRMATGKLLPGEAPLREDEYYSQDVIPARESITRTIRTKFFYDLSAPGKYTAYVDVKDSLTGKRLRTNTAQFEIVASTH
jgi:hypothetical protein